MQQRWRLNGDRASLVAGARFEQNSFTGLEVNPTLRGTYRLDDRHMVWAAVSRSVRVPSRAADDVRANVLTLPPGALARGAPPAVVTIFGSRDVDSEVLHSLESGWRGTLARGLSLELSLFATSFDGLITFARPDPPVRSAGPPLHLVVPRTAVNGGDATITGLELSTTWQPDPRWTLHLACSYLDMRFETLGLRDRSQEGASPRNQLWLRSQHDLTRRLQLDLFAQFQDDVPTADVPSHVRVDLRLGWRPSADLDVDLVAQNLLDPGHAEFGKEFFLGPVNTEIPRSVLAKLVRRF
jgi:iron complex outermembrane receptor protein